MKHKIFRVENYIGRDRADVAKKYFNIFSPVSNFWLFLFAGQRLFGMPILRTIPGSHPFVVSAVGATIVFSSTVLGEMAHLKLSSLFFETEKTSQFSCKRIIYKGILGLVSFAVLNYGNLYHTALPSSILRTGAYAKGHLNGFVKATSDKATEYQRERIQYLGKLFGCHHCGDRQFFSSAQFIADHMPPTAIAELMNKNFLREVLKRPVFLDIM